MVYQKIQQPKLADAIAEQLEQMILEGSLESGERLPSERDLALQLEVSRPTVRDAILRLESKGLLDRRQGRGTWVKKVIDQALIEPLFQLLATHQDAQSDLLEFRHALEGISAYYAALRGTETDFQQLREALDGVAALECKNDPQLQAQAVSAFNIAVTAASHNIVLLHLLRGLNPLLEDNICKNFKLLDKRQGVIEQISQHRSDLLNAILNRQPEQAREACHAHLAYIEQALLDIGREDSRINRASRRIKQAK
jgi:GntR family transcriptional repressor for pyruvate dehydrogenase complex